MNRYTFAALLALLMVFAVFNRTTDLRAIAGERTVRVALVYTPGGGAEAQQIRAAYTETMLENGIPFDWLASTDLAMFDGEQLSDSYAAIVFPDGLNQRVSEDASAELTAFADLGGRVAVVDDAGSRTPDGDYRPGSLFAEISGVDSLLYRSLRSRAFGRGFLRFENPSSLARWSVPNGKIDDGYLASYQLRSVAVSVFQSEDHCRPRAGRRPQRRYAAAHRSRRRTRPRRLHCAAARIPENAQRCVSDADAGFVSHP